MQCKDIPDGIVIEAIKATPGLAGVGVYLDNWRSWTDVLENLNILTPTPIPNRLFLAKISSMEERGIIDACCTRTRNPCSMRIHLMEECRGESCGA